MWFYFSAAPFQSHKAGRMWMKMLPPSTSSGMTLWCFRCHIPSLRRPVVTVVWRHGKTSKMQTCWGMDGNGVFDEYPNWNQQITGCWKMSFFRLPCRFMAFWEGCHSLFHGGGKWKMIWVGSFLVIRFWVWGNLDLGINNQGPENCTCLT